MLTDRELASLILLGVVALIFVIVPKFRRSVAAQLPGVLKLLFSTKLLVPFGLFVLWAALCVGLAALVGVWNLSTLKDTLIVFFGVGFPLLFRALDAKRGTEIVRQVRQETFRLSVVFVFYLNLESLPLWGELIVQPIAAVLALMWAFGQTRPDGNRVAGCFAFLLALVGLALLCWTTVQTIVHLGQTDWRNVVLQLAVSFWLPLALFPFIYAMTFYAAAESIMRRMNWLSKGMPWRAQFGVFLGLRLSVRWAKAMNGRYNSGSQSRTLREALRGMQDFRDDVIRREALDAQKQRDLIAFAGVTDADGTGAQQDRREFHGTKEALRFLHIAQIGRYESRGNRFWDDLTDIVISGYSQYGLPDRHGIVVETTPDQGRYRAWRRTPSGWVLGVGGTSRSGEWLYSADHEPATWPGDQGSEWTDSTREEWPPDWDRYDGTHI